MANCEKYQNRFFKPACGGLKKTIFIMRIADYQANIAKYLRQLCYIKKRTAAWLRWLERRSHNP